MMTTFPCPARVRVCRRPAVASHARYAVLATLCTLLFLAAGCSDAADQRAASSDTTSSVPTADTTATSSSGAKPYEAPPGFPLPFATSLPAGWSVEQIDRGVGETLRFSPGTGSQPSDIELYLYQPGATKQGVTKRLWGKAKGLGAAQKQPAEYDWAFAAYSFEGDRLAGTIQAGRRDSLFFYVMISHAPSADSSFVRQAHAVLDRWQWQ